MKQIFLVFIACLAFQITICAQTGNLPCPKISIKGPSDVLAPRSGTAMFFSVSIENKPEDLKLEYEWEVSAGKIAFGQGTPTIEVDIKDLTDTNVTVAVEIKGLPENCPKTFSETGMIGMHNAHNCLDGYGKVSRERELIELDQVIIWLSYYSEASIVFRLKFKGKPTQKQIDSKILNIAKHFSYRKKLGELNRIAFVIVENESEDYTTICLFSKGREETYCDDCPIIKGSDVDVGKLKKSKKRKR